MVERRCLSFLLRRARNILAALEKLIFRLDGLNCSGGAIRYDILHYHHVAWLRHGEVRLGRHDQAKRLQVGSHFDMAVLAIQ